MNTNKHRISMMLAAGLMVGAALADVTNHYASAFGFIDTRDVGSAASDGVSSLPVGVFDSGIGGMSVLEQLLVVDEFDNASGKRRPDGKPDFENERFVYFGDQANMPYGRYDSACKADFLRELVMRDASFVLGSDGHDPAKVVVIACNTATAYGLDSVLAMDRPHDAKVIGVVNSGVEAAFDAMNGVDSPFAIAVMATPGTIASGVYERTLKNEAAARGVAGRISVVNRGGIGLAEAVERGDPGMMECARMNIVAMVEKYRGGGGKAPIRALILGCTHYPFVMDTIRKTMDGLRRMPEYAGLIAADIKYVDPAVYTAVACYRSLCKDGLLNMCDPGTEKRGRVQTFFSVGKDGPLPDSVKYGRDCGSGDIGTIIVPVSKAGLSRNTLQGIRKSFPACYAAIFAR